MDIKTDWKITRTLEVVLLLIVLAALAGLFGGPWLSQTARASRSGIALEVEYDPILRYGAETILRVTVEHKGDGTARSVAISLDRDYLEGFRIERIMPEPESELPSAAGTRMVFGQPATGRKMDIEVHLRSHDPGIYRTAVKAQAAGMDSEPASVQVKTTVLP